MQGPSSPLRPNRDWTETEPLAERVTSVRRREAGALQSGALDDLGTLKVPKARSLSPFARKRLAACCHSCLALSAAHLQASRFRRFMAWTAGCSPVAPARRALNNHAQVCSLRLRKAAPCNERCTSILLRNGRRKPTALYLRSLN